MMQVRLTPETPDELSRQLREESGNYLAHRRGAVGLSLVAVGAMAVISLYQMGIIKHLPEPPLVFAQAEYVRAVLTIDRKRAEQRDSQLAGTR